MKKHEIETIRSKDRANKHRISLQIKLYGGITFCVLLVLIIGATSYTQIQNQTDEASRVNHSYHVITTSQFVRNQLLRIKTSKMAFRLTNEVRFLTLLAEQRKTLKLIVDSLVSVSADNPKQNTLSRKIRAEVDEYLMLDKNYEGVLSKNEAEAVLVGKEDEVFTTINDWVDEFQKHERSLLEQRKERSDRLATLSVRFIVIGLLLVLILVVILCYRIHKELSGRIKAQFKLKDTINQIELLNTETNEKNWQLEGVSQINNKLQEHPHDIDALAQACIDRLADYLRIPAALFYVFNEEKQLLEPMGGVSVSIAKKKSVIPGDGLAGRAALKREVQVIENIPVDFWQFETGLGERHADLLVYLPLYDAKGLKGLIEIAGINDNISTKLEFLALIADNVARAVATCLDHRKMGLMLEQINQQKEELVAQKDNLAESHEQIKLQTEELRVSEEELRVQQEELRQINTELETQNERLEEARKAIELQKDELERSSSYKSEFLANMSHELRTPLNSILVLAKLMSDNMAGNLSEKQIEYSHIIHKSGSDLLNLINDILDLSKIEAGKIDIFFEDIAVKNILANMEGLFDAVSKDRGINFHIKCQADVPDMIVSDQKRMEQIIKNLLSNAFKFTPSGGEVSLLVSVTSLNNRDMLCIQVRDTGIGIPKDKQESVFKAFQQIDGAINRKYAGTGLGLSISAELANRLNGFIRLQSEIQKGSTFFVYFPLDVKRSVDPSLMIADKDSVAAYDEVTLSAGVKEQDTVADDRHDLQDGDKRILIVEDDLYFSSILADFAHQKGYKVIVALTGDEGVFCAKKYQPSAIILDMNLPVVNGENVLHYIKNQHELQHIPVQIISSQDNPGLNNNDISGYKVKPLAIEEMDAIFALFDDVVANGGIKKVLLIAKGTKSERGIEDVLKNYTNVAVTKIDTEGITDGIKTEIYDVILYYLGRDLDKEVLRLSKLKEGAKAGSGSIILFIDYEIDKRGEMLLQQLSDTIIYVSPKSDERLADELSHFLAKKTLNKSLDSALKDVSSEVALNEATVLIADDDMRNIFALTALLEENGAKVIVANNGEEAIEELHKNPTINIVLMDIMMPIMDGLQAIKVIREDIQYTHLPIIALTAKAMQGDQEKCMDAGASDYITKPLDSLKLLNLIKIWLAK